MNTIIKFIGFIPAILTLIFNISPILAQEAPNSLPPETLNKLNTTLRQIAQQENLPSVAVGLEIKGKYYEFVTGMANLAEKTPRNFPQPFRIGSLTKTFTATVILMLVEAGKLKKTDILSRWYPDFPNADRITIDDLLRMRSGIPDLDDAQWTAKFYDNPLRSYSAEDAIAWSKSQVNQFKEPDTETVYANINYIILGEIAQKVTGKSIGDLITLKILNSLSMNQTFYPTDSQLTGGLRGYGWNPQNRQFMDKTAFNPQIAAGAGAMISNIPDLMKYVKVLCQGGLLTPEMQAERLKSQPFAENPAIRYGEGLLITDKACGHGGSVPGFSTEMYYFPQQQITLVVSVNRLDKDNILQTQKIIAAILNFLPH